MLLDFMMLSVIMYLIFGKPFKNRKLNMLEVVNESMLLMISLMLYCLTDWMPSIDVKIIVGNFMVYTTMLNICVNLFSTAEEIFKIVRR